MDDVKKRVKHILGWVIFRLGLHRWLFRNRGTVVLFHRVDDRHPGNPISSTAEEFSAYCQFFKRHFPVIAIGDLISRLEEDRDVGGTVCITFDDGYRDNRTVAAPELRRLGLPACFFTVSGIIGSSTVPWWDEELGIVSEWMTWDELRDLTAMGFDVGAHTVNHVDLGIIGGEEARREISESRARLEKELGIPVPWFSYPYGRRNQMTEENREIVRELGFRCCLSGYGGDVRRGTDPFRIRRMPISPWYLSPYHFGWEMIFGNR